MHKGDWIEAVTPNDKRFSSSSVDVSLLSPDKQAEAVIEMLMPIRKKVLAVGLGNHEYTLLNTMNFSAHIASQLQAPYGAVLFKLVCIDKHGNTMFKILSHHGRGSLPKGAKDPIQRRANRLAGLKRKLEALGHSDCVYQSMGHDHSALMVAKPTINDDVQLVDDGFQVKEYRRIETPQTLAYIPPESRYYAVVGCMRKGLTPSGVGAVDYGEIGMYGPAALGWVEIHVQGGRIADVEEVHI